MMLVYHVVTLFVLLSLIPRDDARATSGPVDKKTDSTALQWLARLLALKDDKDDLLEGMKELMDAAGYSVKRRTMGIINKSLLYCPPGLYPRAECTGLGRVTINCGVYGEDIDEGNGLKCSRVGDAVCKGNQTCCHLKEEHTNRCIDLSKPYYKCNGFAGFPDCDIKCKDDDDSSDSDDETTPPTPGEITTKSGNDSSETDEDPEDTDKSGESGDPDESDKSGESGDPDESDKSGENGDSSCDENDDSDECKPPKKEEETFECHYECNIPVTCTETEGSKGASYKKETEEEDEDEEEESDEDKEDGEGENENEDDDDDDDDDDDKKDEDKYKTQNKVVHYSIFSNSIHQRRRRAASEGENKTGYENDKEKKEDDKKEDDKKEDDKKEDDKKEDDKKDEKDKKTDKHEETAVAKIPKMSKGVLVDLSTCTLKCTKPTEEKDLKCSSSTGKLTDVFGGKPAELECKDGKCDLHTSAERPLTINVENWYGDVHADSSDDDEESSQKKE